MAIDNCKYSEYCVSETYPISPSQHHGVSRNMDKQPLTADVMKFEARSHEDIDLRSHVLLRSLLIFRFVELSLRTLLNTLTQFKKIKEDR